LTLPLPDTLAKEAEKAKSKASKAKSNAKGGGKGGMPAKAVLKPKSQTPCRFFKKGGCKKGDACEFSHGNGSAAPATDAAKKEQRKDKRARKKAAKAAAAVDIEPSAACPNGSERFVVLTNGRAEEPSSACSTVSSYGRCQGP